MCKRLSICTLKLRCYLIPIFLQESALEFYFVTRDNYLNPFIFNVTVETTSMLLFGANPIFTIRPDSHAHRKIKGIAFH